MVTAKNFCARKIFAIVFLMSVIVIASLGGKVYSSSHRKAILVCDNKPCNPLIETRSIIGFNLDL